MIVAVKNLLLVMHITTTNRLICHDLQHMHIELGFMQSVIKNNQGSKIPTIFSDIHFCTPLCRNSALASRFSK
jgi:hypothetical protein